MTNKDTYKNIFNGNDGYNLHIIDKERYDFVIDDVIRYKHKKLIDISSGRGFLIKYLKELIRDIEITSTDLEKFNNLDVEFIRLDLCEKDDYKNVMGTYDLLSCLDVLEHVEEKYIDDILMFFRTLSNRFCLGVANHPDIQNGIELHLIQEDKDWWDRKLSKYFKIIESFKMYDDKLYCYILESGGD